MKKTIITFSIILCAVLLLCSCGRDKDNGAGLTESESSTETELQTSEEFQTVSPEDIAAEEPASQKSDGRDIVLAAESANPVLSEGQTYTGLPQLPLAEFRVTDPDNARGLSTEKHGYGFGVAKDGKPNQISVDNQAYFDKAGLNAIALDTKSEEKVLYLTFDCGYENGYTQKVLDTLKQKDVPAAFFCTLPQVKSTPELIARMIKEGHIVGNHSVTHPSFPELTRLKMAEEVKGMDDYLRTNFGYSEPFFRFPMGEYSDCSIDLLNSIGYKCVFWSLAYSDWDTSNQKGADYAFNTVTSRLHPGAVILLHAVSPDNSEALGRIIDYAREQGYTFKSLRDLP